MLYEVSEVREGFLKEIQNVQSSAMALDDVPRGGRQDGSMGSRAAVDQSLEFKNFEWQWVIFRGINANLMFHRRCPTIRSD